MKTSISSQIECKTGAELDRSEAVTPEEVERSLESYVKGGGYIIIASVYDRAIARAEPPFEIGQLQRIIDLCIEGIASNHYPTTPVDHDRPGTVTIGINATQAQYASLLGATSRRLETLQG